MTVDMKASWPQLHTHQNSEFFSMAVLSSLLGRGIFPVVRKQAIVKDPCRYTMNNITYWVILLISLLINPVIPFLNQH